jgi:hypothetical protein
MRVSIASRTRSIQYNIIIASFGFNSLQTTLLGSVSGVVDIVAIFTGVTIASRIPNSIAWVGISFFVACLLGVFLVNLLPWHNKVGLLFSVWTTRTHDVPRRRMSNLLSQLVTGVTNFVLALSWVSQTTAGHTKRVTTNAIMLSTYCIGSAAGPFMWKARYKPR